MATHRVGRTPSVEEALQKLSGADIAASPADQSFDEVANSFFDAPQAPSQMEQSAPVEAPEAAAAVPAPQPEVPSKDEPPVPTVIEQLEAAALADDQDNGVDVITTDELLDTIRSSSQNAVRRLAAVTKPTNGQVRPTAPAEPAAPLPGITELSREVERAVASAVAAASYHHDVEQRASTMASTIVSDAAAEAERSLDRAKAECESMLATARSEAKELLSDGKAQRDAIIARAEARAEGVLDKAEVELARRVRHIADTTGAIADIAETALGRLAAGTLTGEQLAQFVTALGTATERVLAVHNTKEQ